MNIEITIEEFDKAMGGNADDEIDSVHRPCDKCGRAVDPWYLDNENSGSFIPFEDDMLYLHKRCAFSLFGQNTRHLKACEVCCFAFDPVSCRNCSKQTK